MAPETSAPRKKVLYVITKANWGGAQRYVYDLALAAKERDYEVILAYGEDGLLHERLEAAKIRTVRIEALGKQIETKSEWQALKALIALMKEEKPDIVHVNSSKGGLALLAARVARVPRILFTAHGWAFNEQRPWWQKLVFRAIYAVTALLSHTTICVSDAVRRDIGWLPFASLVTIKHGIDAPEFLDRNAARTKLLPDAPQSLWIGMVAELHPTKRVEDAIDAVAELSATHPDLQLVVMGDGELKEWLEGRIKHYGLASRVHLVGFVPDAPTYLKAFDLFLMLSRTEALGLALIEAGYAGLPVIASRAGGIPEIVTHKRSGVLIPRENPHSLARAIRILLEQPEEMRAYGAALEASVKERFSKERMLTETLALY